MLALASTLAGNLLIVGSIANIIVVDQARRLGVAIDWRTHARVGVPVTLATLALAAPGCGSSARPLARCASLGRCTGTLLRCTIGHGRTATADMLQAPQPAPPSPPPTHQAPGRGQPPGADLTVTLLVTDSCRRSWATSR